MALATIMIRRGEYGFGQNYIEHYDMASAMKHYDMASAMKHFDTASAMKHYDTASAVNYDLNGSLSQIRLFIFWIYIVYGTFV